MKRVGRQQKKKTRRRPWWRRRRGGVYVGGRTRIVTGSQPLFGTAHLTDAYTQASQTKLSWCRRSLYHHAGARCTHACKGFVTRPQTCLGLGKHASRPGVMSYEANWDKHCSLFRRISIPPQLSTPEHAFGARVYAAILPLACYTSHFASPPGPRRPCS
jgi:hypothetical protein